MRPLPVGIDSFEKLIQENYYYIDKTLLIKELLELKGEVNLFTRPRRFGKTLNLSMLQYFFEDTGDAEQNVRNRALFTGLNIMNAGEEYISQMGCYPVIFLTLKSAKQRNFKAAYFKLKEEISEEFKRHEKQIMSGNISEDDRTLFYEIASGKADREVYSGSLKTLSRLLYQVTGRKVIILVDEYDVPLENAYFSGFYNEMIDFTRSLFESVLKTNAYLQFAVITGCLRISKESIFTGLNHLNGISILDKQYSEHFGFTE